MSNKMRLAILGGAGRMGRELARAIAASDGAVVAAAIEPKGSASIGRDAGDLAGLGASGVEITDDLAQVVGAIDGVLDFTIPKATCAAAAITAKAGLVHVIGTTGLSAAEEAEIATAAMRSVIVKAGNMSLGVNLLTAITRKVAAALDPDFDIEVLEMHHRHKIDAPSGTALMLGQAAAEGRNVTLTSVSVRSRDGHTGARRRGDIGFATLRGGSVVGDHTVIFAGEGERIEITHKAADRGIFARGAVKAALWARGRRPGLYTMTDVLGL
ncbi:MAG TPA: 4-hydroxy-tetrahydrodipicolinate reductase [Hyphomicrobiaceae bacterium]|nr:4-hydroxy-tetrahydrodipicolinate reductase [Hyphomicrobiaceae bacterium]